MSIPQVAICTPARDDVKTDFAYSLACMMMRTERCSLDLMFCRGTLIDANRQLLADQALSKGATHILFIDSDMRFPWDALNRLLAHGRPIVGANYLGRSISPLKSTAKRGSKLVWTTQEAHGLEPVDGMGLGLCLVAAEVFRAIPRPYFAFTFDEATGRHGGEDFYFCDKARAAGFQPYIDHDLSRQVGHIGELAFTFGFANTGRPDAEDITSA